MSYHDNKFRPSHRAAIFRTGQYLATDNITGHTDTKNISHTEIEDQFNGCAGIDATECHGQRVLCVGGRADLTTEVSSEALPGSGSFMAIRQNLQNLAWSDGVLEFMGRIIHILNLVLEVVLIPKSDEAYFNTIGRRGLFLEISAHA